MKKTILIALIFMSGFMTYGQGKVKVAPDCLLVYNAAYNEFHRQFRNDIRECAMGVIMTYIDGVQPSDLIGSL